MNCGIKDAFAYGTAINANEVRKQSNKDKSIMKKLIRSMAVLATGACLMVGTATADPIDLGVYDAPNNPENELTLLNSLIPTYNLANDPDLPLALGFEKTENQSGISNEIDLTGWSYIGLKYATSIQYWYVAGLDSWTFTTPQDLSHYTLFGPEPTNKTPEAGATAILLGTALLGLGAVRRRLGLK